MSDAEETKSLTVQDVTELISSARSGTTDPVSTGISIFQSLWKNSKNFPDYREYSKYCEYGINFSKFVTLRSPKSKLSGKGVWEVGG